MRGRVNLPFFETMRDMTKVAVDYYHEVAYVQSIGTEVNDLLDDSERRYNVITHFIALHPCLSKPTMQF